MTSHHKQQESEYLECNSFLEKYNNLHNTKIKFIKHGNPDRNEPDCICTNDIAIEITSAQDNPHQAEKIHSNTVKQKFNPNLKSVENLENIIFQKLNKLNTEKYNGVTGKIILVCNLESPLVTDKNVDSFIENYTPHSQDGWFDKYFSETWLFWKSKNTGYIKIKQIKI